VEAVKYRIHFHFKMPSIWYGDKHSSRQFFVDVCALYNNIRFITGRYSKLLYGSPVRMYSKASSSRGMPPQALKA